MTAEHVKAKEWREARGLSLDQLAELTGYSPITLYWFERGETPPARRRAQNRGKDDRAIRDWVWLRFKRACASVDHQMRTGREFNW